MVYDVRFSEKTWLQYSRTCTSWFRFAKWLLPWTKWRIRTAPRHGFHWRAWLHWVSSALKEVKLPTFNQKCDTLQSFMTYETNLTSVP